MHLHLYNIWLEYISNHLPSWFELSDFNPSWMLLGCIYSPKHMKWSVNGVLDDDDSLNWVPCLFFRSDWLKLKVILVYDDTPNSSKLHITDHNKQSEGFKAGFPGFPSPSLHRYYDPGLFSHVDTLDKGGDCLWCFLVLWLCSGPPLPHAKCRVCEDMQVARCLCNFPPAPFKRQAQCNNNETVLLTKSNSAWLEFQRFFAWPKDPCYFLWARVRTALVSSWVAGPHGR